MKIHPVVNVSWIIQYRNQVKGQKKEKGKLVEVKGVEKQKVKKILNKRKVRGVVKYLVQWKRFTVKYNSWEKKEDLDYAKKLVAEFEGRMNAEVRRQKRLDLAEEKDFRRVELPGKYITKMLYGWDNGKFKNKYLKKLERNWRR